MQNFLIELKRRHIYRLAAAYAVVAWILLQLVNNLAPGLNLPNWASSLTIVLIAVGFPILLIFAWVLDLKSPDAAARAAAGPLDWVLIGSLVLVLGAVTYQELAPSRGVVADSSGTGVDAARRAAASGSNGVAIAVLPFQNLSGDPSQEFFSDGITEEITSALAKVPDLKVVARTSVYQFRAQNRDIQSIGQQLHATHFIEGSVRKAGDRVRITVQLIKADDDTHLWADDYDRQVTDIFAIQEDIARAITASLRMPLGLKPGENLIANRSIDAESYEQFLHAKQLVRARSAGVTQAIAILEPLVSSNPNYAPAWALLSQAYGFAINARRDNTSAQEFRRYSDSMMPKRKAAAERAAQLDPNLPEAGLVLAAVQTGPKRILAYDELMTKALSVDPRNPDLLNSYANMLAAVGRLSDALEQRKILQPLEPFVPVYAGNLAEALWLNRQDEEAIAVLSGFSTGGGATGPDLARVYASMGRYSEAADLVAGFPSRNFPPELLKQASDLLRTAPKNAAAPEKLPRLATIGFIYLYVGAPERVLEYYEDAARGGVFSPADIALLWHPSYAPVRKTERFKTYMRNANFVDYWRVKGWPPQCHPTTADDFECS